VTVSIEAARAVLRANDRGGYTVPTEGLYPFQWNWDSAFVALGWATFDEDRAWREVERLLEGQWDDGMVPHIVFHQPSDTYFPGPEVWGTRHRVPTSGITQPPVLATTVRRILDGAAGADADDQAAALYPKLLASHRWWARARDPEATGLVAILHNWESGMDNSPAWDAAFARVTAEPSTPITRRDLGHVGVDMRPREEDYRRYIGLVDLYRGLDWDPERIWAAAPFKMVDVATNAILHRAEQDLLLLARRFGTSAEAAEVTGRLELHREAFARLWNEKAGLYQPLDLLTGERVDVATSAGLLPLYARLADEGQAERMAAVLESWGAQVRYLVPSCPPSAPGFEPKRYWRGPVWAIVNAMIAEGLADYGNTVLAARLREDTAALMRVGGFAEYFDPVTGEGAGGGTFSWTAAMALTWTLAESQEPDSPRG